MRMGTANGDSNRRQTRKRSVLAPALLAAALLAAGVALVVWSLSTRTLGELEHEEVSAFSRIRVRRDGDVRALTFVRDNGQEAVQSRVNLTAPHTLMAPYTRAMFAGYLYQPHPRRVLIVGLGGGAMVRFLTHHESLVQHRCRRDRSRRRSPRGASILTCAPVGTSVCIPPTR